MGSAKTQRKNMASLEVPGPLVPASRAEAGLDVTPTFLNCLGEKRVGRRLEPVVHYSASPTVNREGLGQALMCAMKAVFLDLQGD